MRATNFSSNLSPKVITKAQFNPVFILIAALFLFCLPFNQIQLPASGFHHPVIAFSLLMIIFLICIGIQQIARSQQISLTPLTYWIILATALAIIPIFYTHANTHNAVSYTGEILLILLSFCTLQQFTFTYQQRQSLLWFPMLSGWVIATLIAFFVSPFAKLNWQDIPLEPTISAIILLTSLALSAYLLARTHIYKRSLTINHLILLLTPMVSIIALMALQQFHLLFLTITVIILPQIFLYKFCQKEHHILWVISALLGFTIAAYLNLLPPTTSFLSHFLPKQIALIKQTLALLASAPFDGVGSGQLNKEQLLFGLSLQNPMSMPSLYPSWIIEKITEGGVIIWICLLILTGMILKRLSSIPDGTRLVLIALLLPSIYAIFTTPFIQQNPILIYFMVIWLYWIDNLSTRYHRFSFQRVYYLTPLVISIIISASLFVFSSVYLGGKMHEINQLTINRLKQYQLHPWWSSFYQTELEKRLFLQSIENKDKILQERYIRQQLMMLTQNPNAADYQALIDAAILAKQDAIVHQLKLEASMLFPHNFPTKEALETPKTNKDSAKQ